MGQQDTAAGDRPDEVDGVNGVGAQRGSRSSAQTSFAVTLRRLRLEEGMSLRELARRLGYSAHSTIADFESGRRLPSETLVRECEALFAVTAGSLVAQRRQVLAEKAASDPAFGRHGESRLPPAATPDSPPPADPVGLRSAALALIEALDGRPSAPTPESRGPGGVPDGNAARDHAADQRPGDASGLNTALLLLLRAAMLHLAPPTEARGTGHAERMRGTAAGTSLRHGGDMPGERLGERHPVSDAGNPVQAADRRSAALTRRRPELSARTDANRRAANA
ncbi:helix-turn-helix transcriptional regulator [Streptomyces sp. V4-01]|uniref:Helix-turn-helix transcriptional regulator n=1 Tax=Actinacidiphila polyblastidii TaxID=3110430 RepID=A0ABU7PFH2_9ACTN|nr:helix-turn-helix transcriptional regulator [Streptomyces sp. V4-01]